MHTLSEFSIICHIFLIAIIVIIVIIIIIIIRNNKFILP